MHDVFIEEVGVAQWLGVQKPFVRSRGVEYSSPRNVIFVYLHLICTIIREYGVSVLTESSNRCVAYAVLLLHARIYFCLVPEFFEFKFLFE
jgi:hypothetical protein